MSNPYLQPMRPWPSLAQHARTVLLPKSGLRLFVFDTADERDGGQAPVLLIHGLGDEADTWRYVVEPLAQRRRVIALDLPGFGRSDKPRRAYSLTFFSDIIIELLDVLEIMQVSLVGHSLGGLIAHTVALGHPERLSNLTLIDGCLSPQPQQVSAAMVFRLLPLVGERYYNGLRGHPDAAYASLAAYYLDITRLPEADRQFLYQRVNERVWSNGQRDAYFSALRQMPIWMMRNQRDILPRLEALAVPTVVVWGQDDRIVPVRAGQALVAIQSSARLTPIFASGHMPQQEQPDAVVQAIATER